MSLFGACKPALPTIDQIRSITSMSREAVSISDGQPCRRRIAREHTTQTMGYREKHDHRLVGVTCAHQPKRREVIRSLTGLTISKYRIVAKLGSGGMGAVYRAKDVRLGRNVALKVASNDMLTQADLYRWMLREAHAGSALNHPNVCAVYDIGEFQGLPFIVMELLEGQTLKERIQKPLTMQKFLHLAIQICDGLDAVHSRGIVHRDIKPSNIFVTTAENPKIFDFGLAIMTNGSEINQHLRRPHQTKRNVRPGPFSVLGTPMYMSPEHILGEPLDCRTDLFSLGIVFYEMLTGERPFQDPSSWELRELVPVRSLVPISRLRPDLPSPLAHLVERALEIDREFRWQVAAEVRADLKRIQRDLRFGGSR
jgi:serine/threonine protein kinase